MNGLLRISLRLFLMHIAMIIIIWLGGYFHPLEQIFAGYYIILLAVGGCCLTEQHPAQAPRLALLGGGISQIPGLLLALANLLSYNQILNVSSDWTYALLIWQTPFVPWLTNINYPVLKEIQFYFLALNFAWLIVVGCVFGSTITYQHITKHRWD